MPGKLLSDVWTDISPINSQAQERLGYPTQKPLALLERILQASSNAGDLVLDPFCGCGTAVAAAHSLKRRWIGIDITHLSISLMKYRLKDMYGLVEKQDYAVIGEPEDLESARALARSDRYQFQWWALSLVQAKPLGGEGASREGKKGSDRGIDGMLNFLTEKNKTEKILVQVKSGHVKSGDIRDLHGVLQREGAAMGVFISLEEPSREMVTEACSAGFYHSDLWQKDYPLIQILTIEDIFAGKGIQMPPSAYGTFKQAGKVKKEDASRGIGNIDSIEELLSSASRCQPRFPLPRDLYPPACPASFAGHLVRGVRVEGPEEAPSHGVSALSSRFPLFFKSPPFSLIISLCLSFHILVWILVSSPHGRQGFSSGYEIHGSGNQETLAVIA